MTLPASGNITLIEITEELFGVGVTGKTLLECGTEAGFSPPVSMSDFYSYAQSWGRVYSDISISYTAYIKRLSEGSYYQVVSPETLRFTGDRNENVAVYQDNDGSDTPISAGETITLKLYRRTKQTSDSWTLDTTFNTYTSGSFGLILSSYDYKIVLEPDP